MPVPDSVGISEKLLRSTAEELKLPLLQIARQAEVARLSGDQTLLEDIETAASHAMWFIDSYLLSHQLLQQPHLELEPITVSASMYDAAHKLDKLAKQYDCDIELRLSGRYGPVMAHKEGLETALVGLGSTLIMGAAPDARQKFVLGAHKGKTGVVTGVFSADESLSQQMYRQGRALHGKARQPLGKVSAQAGAGVFIADSLFSSMESQLRVARHSKLTGLAATLQPSRQMVLV